MKTLLFLSLLLVTIGLHADKKAPWLGNLFEFEGTLFQEHTESKRLDTTHGKVKKHLYSNYTKANLSFTPVEDMSVAIELDMNETQSHSYGFDAFRGVVRYQWLDDLKDDAISLTTGLSASISPKTRVRDLSSQNHGYTEGQFDIGLGKEFWQKESNRWSAWSRAKVGIAAAGAPWIGGEFHLEKVFHDRHFASCFVRSEKGLSSHKLHSARDFKSWAQVGYQFEEVGVRYLYKKYGVGSCVFELTKRVHARYCPDNSWTISVGVIVPFSPW